MKPRRRHPSLATKVGVLLRQAQCAYCGEMLHWPGADNRVEYHHVQEIALDGPDTADNLIAVHAEPCHRQLTNGIAATTAGSSKHRIAKVKRLSKDHKAFWQRMQAKMADETSEMAAAMARRPPWKWPKRSFKRSAKRD